MCTFYGYQYNVMSYKLATTQDVLATEINDNKIINKELGEINEQLSLANSIIAELKSDEYELIYIGDYKISHYCTEKREHICGTGNGKTATGTMVTPGRTIAVDPNVIPYGTEVYIEGYGWRTAEDCGGGVKGKHIDMAVDTHNNAMSMGIKYAGVWLLIKKS